MIYRRRNSVRTAVLFLLLLTAFIISSAFIKVPFTIKSMAEIFPKEKWIITAGNGSQINFNLIDYTRGHSSHYNISQFERGEFVTTDFIKHLNDKKEVALGDTIISMQSTYIIDQIVSAEGALEIAFAELKSQRTGEKEPLIKEAENRLKYNEEKIAEQITLFGRTKQLFEKGLCSLQDYELQKWNIDLLNIESKIYKSQIESLKTGVKPETINLLEARIKSARNYLMFLKQKETQLTLLSPISGKIVSSFSPDTLLKVIDYTRIILHEPVKLADLPAIKEGSTISVSFTGFDEVYTGYILSIEKEIKIINGQQIAFVSLMFDNPDARLLPGMIVENSLNLKKTTLLDSILRLIIN